MKYWAIDYINSELAECELVCDDQLYKTEEEAYAIIDKLPRRNLYEVSWYSEIDLRDIYDTDDIEITEDLRVIY